MPWVPKASPCLKSLNPTLDNLLEKPQPRLGDSSYSGSKPVHTASLTHECNSQVAGPMLMASMLKDSRGSLKYIYIHICIITPFCLKMLQTKIQP